MMWPWKKKRLLAKVDSIMEHWVEEERRLNWLSQCAAYHRQVQKMKAAYLYIPEAYATIPGPVYDFWGLSPSCDDIKRKRAGLLAAAFAGVVVETEVKQRQRGIKHGKS